MNAAQLINQTSGEVEIYTPAKIIEAARVTLGGFIELDPASSEKANETVKARRFFTLKDDGLNQIWAAQTLWMNHPFSRKGNPMWINKLIRNYEMRYTRAACCITFASTSEAWFRPLRDFPQCYLSPRTNYLLPDGTVYKGVTKGSVVTYLGPNVELFRRAFEGEGLGKVKV